MGAEQSSHSLEDHTFPGGFDSKIVRGRKYNAKMEAPHGLEDSIVSEFSHSDLHTDLFFSSEHFASKIASVEESLHEDSDEDGDSDDESSVDEESEEEDEEWTEYLIERRQVFEDAINLKRCAVFFAHPEKSVVVDGTATARCYFDRNSAPERMTPEDAEECARMLEDMTALKKFAMHYMHPEMKLEVDPFCMGRNYFERPSAGERLSQEEAEERAQIIADAKALKKVAVDYLHPEIPVTTNDAFSFGRNYFTRPYADLPVKQEDAEEYANIMDDVKALKKLAVDYMHPEVPVVTSDPFACGRNYFSRPSAEPYEEEDDADDRDDVLADVAALKKYAEYFMHPEKPVVVDPTCFGRNYYSRASAEPQESVEEAEERAQILADALALKQKAVDYMHPEVPVVTTDPTAFGRNFFSRSSATQQDDLDESEERARILADALALKQKAVDYMHPELPVTTSDPCACGRNYFTRPSAEPYDEDFEERLQALEDAKALKKLAVDYMHPEVPVVTSDPFACGRNYYARPSAEPYEEEDDADDRDDVLADIAALKKYAEYFMHPEKPVVVDPECFGRNYFGRASAEPQDSAGEAEDRAQILADAVALKQKAFDYMHPELPVVSTDPTAFGRNFFTRPSAPQKDDVEEAEERARIIADALALKQKAIDYMHPELPVVTSDPFACGRNYFTRPSAEPYEEEEDADDRDDVLADVAALKKYAEYFMHPQKLVVVDPTCFGRNYFGRASSEPQESVEEAEERAQIFADALALKQKAVDFLHPEIPVVTTDPTAFGRNFFTRPSAPQQFDAVEAEESAHIIADALALKQKAIDYMHPELPVVTSDPFACGRNFFCRASAEFQTIDPEDEEEHESIMADLAALKKFTSDYMHPEKPVEVDPTCFGRNYFSRASVEEIEDCEYAKERACVLADAAALQEVAIQYLHPEIGVVTKDPNACGRNYFDRKAARGHYHMIHTFPAQTEDDHSNHEHMDHFGMDDEMDGMFDDMRHELDLPIDCYFSQATTVQASNTKLDSNEEGNLSRSPSTVMLFTEQSIYD